jgi:hypothetical protein
MHKRMILPKENTDVKNDEISDADSAVSRVVFAATSWTLNVDRGLRFSMHQIIEATRPW